MDCPQCGIGLQEDEDICTQCNFDVKTALKKKKKASSNGDAKELKGAKALKGPKESQEAEASKKNNDVENTKKTADSESDQPPTKSIGGTGKKGVFATLLGKFLKK